jgi:hypothetical protein
MEKAYSISFDRPTKVSVLPVVAALCTKDFATAVADGFETGSEKNGDKRIQTKLNVVGASE